MRFRRRVNQRPAYESGCVRVPCTQSKSRNNQSPPHLLNNVGGATPVRRCPRPSKKPPTIIQVCNHASACPRPRERATFHTQIYQYPGCFRSMWCGVGRNSLQQHKTSRAEQAPWPAGSAHKNSSSSYPHFGLRTSSTRHITPERKQSCSLKQTVHRHSTYVYTSRLVPFWLYLSFATGYLEDETLH